MSFIHFSCNQLKLTSGRLHGVPSAGSNYLLSVRHCQSLYTTAYDVGGCEFVCVGFSMWVYANLSKLSACMWVGAIILCNNFCPGICQHMLYFKVLITKEQILYFQKIIGFHTFFWWQMELFGPERQKNTRKMLFFHDKIYYQRSPNYFPQMSGNLAKASKGIPKKLEWRQDWDAFHAILSSFLKKSPHDKINSIFPFFNEKKVWRCRWYIIRISKNHTSNPSQTEDIFL